MQQVKRKDLLRNNEEIIDGYSNEIENLKDVIKSHLKIENDIEIFVNEYGQ